MDDDNIVLRLENICFAYPAHGELFRDFNLTVARDDRVGVVGANGSGKTTLFYLIMGLLRHAAGRLFVLDREVRCDVDRVLVRRNVGFLFQNSEDQLFCPTVEDDVAFGPLNLGLDEADVRKIVAETLAGMHLSAYAGQVTDRLSGGEKRLVALATVLAMKPDVLLLDEPASGLDPRARRRLIGLLDEIGRTQVISSHDMEFVRATCTRVVVLDQGRVTADEPTDQVLGDAEMLLRTGLEQPYSLGAHLSAPLHDHHHGAGPSHGHGHDDAHDLRQHDLDQASGPSAPAS